MHLCTECCQLSPAHGASCSRRFLKHGNRVLINTLLSFAGSLSVAPVQATVSEALRMEGARCPLIMGLSVRCRAIPATRPGRGY
jgi:hypothetical protein